MPKPSTEKEPGAARLESRSFDAFAHDFDSSIQDKLGSHIVHHQNQAFTRFSVWAPNARQVSVVGDFNQWSPDHDPLFPIEGTGVWTTLIPGDLNSQRYQFSIIGPQGQRLQKTDPFSTQYVSPIDRSAVVGRTKDVYWNDQPWMHQRMRTDWKRAPISIYELHLGSWRKPFNVSDKPLCYRNIAEPLAKYVAELGFTHVLLMPLMEHPYDGSWGYQVTGYFAATNRYGSPEDLAFLVDTLHQHHIGVLFDWVPAHFPKDDFALYQFDGGPCFENPCPEQGQHPDWGTAIFDYGKPEVLSFLMSSALYWIETFHFDGIRVDAVASMIYRDYSRPSGDWTPNVDGGNENLEATRFLRLLNDEIRNHCPGVIRIAEESTPWPGVTKATESGGLGFDFKWNLGWMHDTLTYFTQPTSDRTHARTQLILPATYQEQENFCLPFSHDEVVHGKGSMIQKMPGDDLKIQADELRSLYAWMWAWPGKKLLFMGNDFAQLSEWDHAGSLDWESADRSPHCGLKNLVCFLNEFYRQHPSLAQTDVEPDRFTCPMQDNGKDNVFRFSRKGKHPHNTLICIGNFSASRMDAYRLGVPLEGRWKISLNSTWLQFQGSSPNNQSTPTTSPIPWHDQPQSITLDLPAHATLFLAPADS